MIQKRRHTHTHTHTKITTVLILLATRDILRSVLQFMFDIEIYRSIYVGHKLHRFCIFCFLFDNLFFFKRQKCQHVVLSLG